MNIPRMLGSRRLACLLLCAAASTLLAQQSHQISEPNQQASRKDAVQNNKSISRLLTSDEGLAILGAALESRHHAGSRLDCSHLVHAIYERAGFPYSYVSSSDLYTGIDEFRRVIHPQPGDLVVWRGHVGIEINPVQHSFFSALRSGLGVESYDSSYWRQLGKPRFFRYVRVTTSRLSGSAETTTLKPSSLRNDESYKPESTALNGSQAVDDGVGPSAMQPADPFTSHVPVVNSVRPSRNQLRYAFSQAVIETENALRGRDVLQLSQSLVVFNSFEVGQVHLTGNQGWAEVLFHGSSFLTGGRVKPGKSLRREHWTLARRDAGTWELILAPETTYLSSDVAARILAHQLAALTDAGSDSAADHEKQFQLARLLNVILTSHSGHPEHGDTP